MSSLRLVWTRLGCTCRATSLLIVPRPLIDNSVISRQLFCCDISLARVYLTLPVMKNYTLIIYKNCLLKIKMGVLKNSVIIIKKQEHKLQSNISC